MLNISKNNDNCITQLLSLFLSASNIASSNSSLSSVLLSRRFTSFSSNYKY